MFPSEQSQRGNRYDFLENINNHHLQFFLFFPQEVCERESGQEFFRRDCDVGDLVVWDLGVGIKGLGGK